MAPHDSRPEPILLHVCCGPCATHAAEALAAERPVTLFWSNSNIWPAAEHELRLDAARSLATALGAPLAVDEPDHEAWRTLVAGLEDEPERGRRCLRCFERSFERAADYALAHGFRVFTTTLTISPHKDTEAIFAIGRAVAERHGLGFLERDFKKRDGFAQSIRLAKEHGLYRQRYCGCEFSRR